MRHLTEFRIRIPGQWSDAWLYKESVILWNPAGEISWISQESLRRQVAREAGPIARLVADYLLFRNDWKYGEQFASFARSPRLLDTLLDEACGAGLTAPLVVNCKPKLAPTNERIEGFLLDVAVTGNRIFSATTTGLFETEFNPEYADAGNPLIRTAEGRVSSVAVASNSAAIAMEEGGLRTAPVRFDLGRAWYSEPSPFKRIDDYAMSTSFSAFNLLNYNGESAPEFFRAKTKKVTADGLSAFDRTLIVDHEQPISLLKPVEDAVSHGRSSDRSPEGLYVVGNSNYRLLVSDGNEYASVINVGWGSQAEHRGVVRNRNFSVSFDAAKAVSRTTETRELKSGFLLESSSGISLVTERGFHPLEDKGVLRTRTFPRSRRHADSFASVCNDHVDLVGFLERR